MTKSMEECVGEGTGSRDTLEREMAASNLFQL
jgi:hypothetical protein